MHSHKMQQQQPLHSRPPAHISVASFIGVRIILRLAHHYYQYWPYDNNINEIMNRKNKWFCTNFTLQAHLYAFCRPIFWLLIGLSISCHLFFCLPTVHVFKIELGNRRTTRNGIERELLFIRFRQIISRQRRMMMLPFKQMDRSMKIKYTICPDRQSQFINIVPNSRKKINK